jgi:hypothetical protein
MVFSGWESLQTMRRKPLPKSTSRGLYIYSNIRYTFTVNRERREHRVFRLLLQMIPGMEDRLMEGSEEDVAHMAELVHNSVVPRTRC